MLAHILGLHARPANQGGTSYATGGARNHDTNFFGSELFPNAVPTETQIDNYAATHTPSGNALYVISSGDNDIAFALTNPNNQFGDPAVIGAAAVQANQEASIIDPANTLADKIASVQTNNNVKYVIVTKLAESFGTPALKMLLRADYNAAFKSRLDSLNVNYALADVNSVRQQVNGNPANFGINSAYLTTAAGQRACTDPVTGPDPNLAISSGWAFLCSPTSPVSTPISSTVAKEAMFADDGHFATGGQRIFGSYFYCLVKKPGRNCSRPAPRTSRRSRAANSSRRILRRSRRARGRAANLFSVHATSCSGFDHRRLAVGGTVLRVAASGLQVKPLTATHALGVASFLPLMLSL